MAGKAQIYEIGYHFLPTTSEAEIPELVAKVQFLIEGKEGKIISEEMPKLQALAYKISANLNSKKQKFDRAYFGWIKFEADNSRAEEIKKSLEGFEKIIRFILIKTVRGDTMFYPKFQRLKKDDEENIVSRRTEIREISEEEIDKSIEQLVIV